MPLRRPELGADAASSSRTLRGAVEVDLVSRAGDGRTGKRATGVSQRMGHRGRALGRRRSAERHEDRRRLDRVSCRRLYALYEQRRRHVSAGSALERRCSLVRGHRRKRLPWVGRELRRSPALEEKSSRWGERAMSRQADRHMFKRQPGVTSTPEEPYPSSSLSVART